MEPGHVPEVEFDLVYLCPCIADERPRAPRQFLLVKLGDQRETVACPPSRVHGCAVADAGCKGRLEVCSRVDREVTRNFALAAEFDCRDEDGDEERDHSAQ